MVVLAVSSAACYPDTALAAAPQDVCQRLRPLGTSAALLETVDRPRPVAPQQARQGPVGQQLATRLAAWAVVALVLGVGDALDGRAAVRTGLAVTAVDGHRR